MNEPIWQLKQEMCEIGHRIWQRGYCAGNEGNHSFRISDDRVLSTPTGLSKGFLKPDMICTVDMDGKQVDTNNRYKRTSEILVHLAIYEKRPDIKAVVHSHPPHATAFAVAEMPIPEGIHPEAEIFLGRVPMAHYATPGGPDLADSILKFIGPETNSIVLGNHGTVNFSDKTLTDAYYKLEILDAYCRILLLSHQLGRINQLSNQELNELLQVKQMFGMTDERAACALDGCIGEQNQPFLAQFDVRPATAVCDGQGDVQNTTTTDMDEQQFESMVQAITDQIMSAVK